MSKNDLYNLSLRRLVRSKPSVAVLPSIWSDLVKYQTLQNTNSDSNVKRTVQQFKKLTPQNNSSDSNVKKWRYTATITSNEKEQEAKIQKEKQNALHR